MPCLFMYRCTMKSKHNGHYQSAFLHHFYRPPWKLLLLLYGSWHGCIYWKGVQRAIPPVFDKENKSITKADIAFFKHLKLWKHSITSKRYRLTYILVNKIYAPWQGEMLMLVHENKDRSNAFQSFSANLRYLWRVRHRSKITKQQWTRAIEEIT